VKSIRGEFMRKLGCLRIELQHLDDGLRANDLNDIEERSRTIQELLLDLVKQQRRLTRSEQTVLRPRFAALRQDALHSLEVARRILDDSLEALLWLMKAVQDTSGYGHKAPGGSIIVDRKA
jgi:DNA anti-recombination protein RmuC